MSDAAMDAPVFVTGASGFIARALTAALRDAGTTVRGVDVVALSDPDVVGGDVTDAGSWQAHVRGCQTVVHTAALVTNTARREHAWRVNVLGTRRVLDAAIQAGARRFVLLSSVRAFGDADFPDGVTEAWPVRPDGSVYVDTKIAAEQVALQAHAAGEIDVTVIRPGDVYGPESRPWTILALEEIRRRRFVLPAMGRGVFSPIFIDDLVAGLRLAAARDRARGQVITLSGGIGVPTSEFFGHYARMLGRSGRIPAVPTVAAVAGAGALTLGARIAAVHTELNPESARYLARTGTYSIDKARALLDWDPEVGLDDGMARTETWLRSRHLL